MEISKSYKELLKNHFLTEADAIPKTKIIQKPQKTFRKIVVVILSLSRDVVSIQALNFVQMDVFWREGLLPTLLRSHFAVISSPLFLSRTPEN